ncbi:pterin-4-alpha-carbinolamine dehydratase 2 isoform X2 [Lithobates pipiens]
MCSFLFVSRTARLISSSVCSRGLISSLYSNMTSEAHLLTPEERTQILQQLQSLGWIEVTARDAIYKEFAFKTFNQALNCYLVIPQLETVFLARSTGLWIYDSCGPASRENESPPRMV